jgi:hypothetical protein
MPLPTNATPEQSQLARRVTAGSDYWLSDARIRENLVILIQSMDFGTPKKSAQDVAQEADRRMKSDDPRIMLLVMSCGDKDVTALFQPANHSKYADIPFKPAHYTIVPPRDDGKPGQFRVTLSFKDGAKTESFRASAPGTLDVDQFDAKGLSGRFAFQAESVRKDNVVEVSGQFRFSCAGDKCTK